MGQLGIVLHTRSTMNVVLAILLVAAAASNQAEGAASVTQLTGQHVPAVSSVKRNYDDSAEAAEPAQPACSTTTTLTAYKLLTTSTCDVTLTSITEICLGFGTPTHTVTTKLTPTVVAYVYYDEGEAALTSIVPIYDEATCSDLTIVNAYRTRTFTVGDEISPTLGPITVDRNISGSCVQTKTKIVNHSILPPTPPNYPAVHPPRRR